MLFLSDSPYLKLLFYIDFTIIKAFMAPVSVSSPRRTWPPVTTTAGRSAARHARYHDLR